MDGVLYHFTCKEHLEEILSSQYLKLTDSNIITPDGTLETERRSQAYKPVVWLTDSEYSNNIGLEGSVVDKTEIKITVLKKDYMVRWEDWGPQKEMEKAWRRRFCRNQKISSWYISEQIIPFSDILRIENRYDGTVYYGEPDPNRREIPRYHEDGRKAYPNDPCPCGSGKKFKKCCGRNSA